jgi:hypothetical protein
MLGPMICTSCGHLNDGDAGECARCGGKLEKAPTGPSAKCPACGATVFGSPGVVPCTYCGGRVDIPAGGAPAWRPPTDAPLRKDDIDVLEMREVRRSSDGNGGAPFIAIGIVGALVLAAIAGGIAESSKHHKKKSKYSSSRTSSTHKQASVFQPPRFEPIARKATLTNATGALPFSGKTCDVRISPLQRSDECRVWITCGSLRVYGGANSWVKCGPSGGTPTFVADLEPTLQDGDAQLHLDLPKGTATLSDTSLAGDSYMATFRLDPTTDAPPPAPPTFTAVTRTVTVTSKIGSAPMTSPACELRISPLPDPDFCRVWLTCGGKRVYGSNTSTTRCEASNDGPVILNDWQPSTRDRDAKLQANLMLGVGALGDTTSSGDAYLVKFRSSK